jgi:Pentapeptide repeats (8 copies)
LQPSKSLWDWLNLLGVLAIPAVVGLGAAWYTAQQGKVSARENTDNQREAALQEYIDKMSELLLKENLRESSPNDGVRIVARARTLNVLHRLDRERKGIVIQFLFESDLLSIVDLSYADLSDAHLFRANLTNANLFCADLRKANLFLATLVSVNLSEAYMPEADLRGASLNLADLSGANICFADLRGANLTGAILYNKTTGMKVKLTKTEYNKESVPLQYPLLTEGISLDPTVWPDGFGHEAAKAAGAICVDC